MAIDEYLRWYEFRPLNAPPNHDQASPASGYSEANAWRHLLAKFGIRNYRHSKNIVPPYVFVKTKNKKEILFQSDSLDYETAQKEAMFYFTNMHFVYTGRSWTELEFRKKSVFHRKLVKRRGI